MLAQLVERNNGIVEVIGSIPLRSILIYVKLGLHIEYLPSLEGLLILIRFLKDLKRLEAV